MMIDLTYKCSMGCSHCLSACNSDGQHMSLDVLNDTCDFISRHKIDTVTPLVLSLSGGEIFEHSQILNVLISYSIDLVQDLILVLHYQPMVEFYHRLLNI